MRAFSPSRRGIAATVATLGLTAAAVAAAPTAQADTTGGYVALGDSYSAGVGAGSYISSSGDCEQSTNAYPYLWAQANNPSSFSFQACSGATTATVLSSQLSALNSSTSLVSISVGGDDAGFSSVMETCVLDGTSDCQTAVTNAENFVNTQLAPKLDAVYSAIQSDAPNASVTVMGYPELYEIPGDCWFGISTASETALNGAADDIDGVISTEAAKYGFNFGDVRPAFSGHQICSDDSWMNSTTVPVSSSYHPDADGQASGYLPTFSAFTG